MKKTYQCLDVQEYKKNEFSLVPIRLEDRYKIMQWRNEQMYHLRQSKTLTRQEQDRYFNTVVLSLFDQEKPDQVLFSFLKKKDCVGYGGLVHIDWREKTAEISFIINTALENESFIDFWLIYLKLIEDVAFQQLQLGKIFIYSYELRPELYKVINLALFREEKRIKRVKKINNDWVDALIHSKYIE